MAAAAPAVRVAGRREPGPTRRVVAAGYGPRAKEEAVVHQTNSNNATATATPAANSRGSSSAVEAIGSSRTPAVSSSNDMASWAAPRRTTAACAGAAVAAARGIAVPLYLLCRLLCVRVWVCLVSEELDRCCVIAV